MRVLHRSRIVGESLTVSGRQARGRAAQFDTAGARVGLITAHPPQRPPAFRCLISKRRDLVRLESRTGRDMSECFPELVDEIRPIPQDFVADAELVVLDEQGRPVWERLKARHVIRKPERIRQAAASDPAALFAFDLLWLNGADFRVRPLLERKAALHRLLPLIAAFAMPGTFWIRARSFGPSPTSTSSRASSRKTGLRSTALAGRMPG